MFFRTFGMHRCDGQGHRYPRRPMGVTVRSPDQRRSFRSSLRKNCQVRFSLTVELGNFIETCPHWLTEFGKLIMFVPFNLKLKIILFFFAAASPLILKEAQDALVNRMRNDN
jgi:hypothetical protein